MTLIRDFISKLIACIDSLSRLTSIAAALLCIFLVFLTFQQVIARYFFDASSVGLQELEWHLFGFVFLLAMGHTLRKDGHVRVDFLSSRLHPKAKALVEMGGILLFLIPMCLVFISFGTSYAMKAYSYASTVALDYWSASFFAKDGSLYRISSGLESLLRSSILVGEVSPDSGGLEARWIIKAAVPLGFFVLLLQALAQFLRQLLSFSQSSPDGR